MDPEVAVVVVAFAAVVCVAAAARRVGPELDRTRRALAEVPATLRPAIVTLRDATTATRARHEAPAPGRDSGGPG